MAEALDVDLELVGVEADGHVELEAGGDGVAGGGDVAGEEGDEAGGVVDGVGGAGVCSMPATATRTVPATGFLMSRVQGLKAEP